MKKITRDIGVLLGVAICSTVAFYAGRMSAADLTKYIPSTHEIQRELNRRDPTLKLKLDGKCGINTQKSWDLACNNQISLLLWPK